jgi:hypothetical protein
MCCPLHRFIRFHLHINLALGQKVAFSTVCIDPALSVPTPFLAFAYFYRRHFSNYHPRLAFLLLLRN